MLHLPLGCQIFIIFHIGSLIKPFVQETPSLLVLEIPPLTIDTHPIAIPQKEIAYWKVIKKAKSFEQVHVDWIGLPLKDQSWEDVTAISSLKRIVGMLDASRISC